MTIKYKIYWISMWSYAICNNLLNREFSIKWWDSLKIDQVISQVHKTSLLQFRKPLLKNQDLSLS